MIACDTEELEQTDYYNTEIWGSAEEIIIKSFQQ